ncbi:MAG TPA: response regulator [Bacteroidia bacterium]|nr:response regulator [Bacteroidia bacterium]
MKRGEFSETDQGQPDLIFLDLNMPLLDGYGALTQIRSNLMFKDLPIYVLSTSGFEYDHKKSKQLGANDFFTKPTRLPELKDIIKNICLHTIETLNKL